MKNIISLEIWTFYETSSFALKSVFLHAFCDFISAIL